MSMIVAGSIIAGGAIVGGIAGGVIQGNAAKHVAEEQSKMAKDVLTQQKSDRETAVGYSAPSMEELKMIQGQMAMANAALQAQLVSLDNDRQLLNSVDPALREAGTQALSLLQGHEAAALGPIKTERARQRQMLESQLRDQLGSGYQTSSAGREALNQFDSETTGLMTNAQQSTLGAFLGLSAQMRPDMVARNNAAYGTVSQMFGSAVAAQQNVAARKVAAFTGSAPNYQNVINTAGAQYMGGMATGQAISGAAQGLGQIGGTMMGYGMTKGLMASMPNGTVNIATPGSMSIPAVPQSYNSTYFGPIR